MTEKKLVLETVDEVIQKIVDLMLEKKALDIKVLDIRKLTTLTDYFIICSSESNPQTKAIADHVDDELRRVGVKPWHIEGYDYLKWVLLDYSNIVVHVFNEETRDYYGMERLWADAKITSFSESNE
jgi:ribosome-associated protein